MLEKVIIKFVEKLLEIIIRKIEELMKMDINGDGKIG